MTPFEAWECGYALNVAEPFRDPALAAVFLEGFRARSADDWCDDRNPTPNPYRETP